MNTISRSQSYPASSRDPQPKATVNDQRSQLAGSNKPTSDTNILRLGGTSGPSLYPDHLRTGGAWKTSKLKDEAPSLTGTGGGGGDGGGNSTPPDIVVEGPRSAPDTSTPTPPPSTDSSLPPDVVVQGQRSAPEKTSPAPAPSLADRIVTVAINNPTQDEQRIINAFKGQINNVGSRMSKLADKKVLSVHLSDGSTKDVTGAEVKKLWSNAKFQIDPAGTPYPNGTSRGASKDENGVTHFAVDLLQSYAPAGTEQSYTDKAMAYVILHDISHNTEAGTAENLWQSKNGTKDQYGSYPNNEKIANSIAKAIEIEIGLDPLATVNYDYDERSTHFADPST